MCVKVACPLYFNVLKVRIWKDKMGKYWTLDHRRLAALKMAGKCVPYDEVDSNSKVVKKANKSNRKKGGKMTTSTEGKTMEILDNNNNPILTILP